MYSGFCKYFSNLLNMAKNYYAVGRGRKVGVFETWGECKQQVEKIANAQFRKFDSLEKAWAFVKECQGKYSPYKSPKKTQLSQSTSVRSTSPSLLSNSTLPVSSCIKALDNLFSNPSTSATVNIRATNIEVSNSQESNQTLQNLEQVDILQKQLTNVQEHHEEVSQGLVQELDEVKRKCEALSNVTGEIKCVLDKLSELETQFKISQIKVKAELKEIKVSILSMKFSNGIQSQNVGETSIRKRLSKYTVPQPISQKRKFSSSQNSTESSLNVVDGPFSNEDDDAVEVVPVPPRKVVKIELSDSEESNSDFQLDPDGNVIIFTDGACERNGQKGAKAGIGVWFADNHPLNCSQPVQGRATNNTAEIQAACFAIEIAKKAGIRKILLNTDSMFVINCVTQWMSKWKKNNWKLVNGGPVKNKEDLINLDDAMKGMTVKWNHIRGHCGIYGNEMADRLARAGAELYRMS